LSLNRVMSDSINKLGKAYALLSLLLSIGIVLSVLLLLLIYSWDALAQQGWGLLTVNWHPASNQFGIIAMLYGSLSVTIIALAIAVPAGLFTALYIAEIMPNKFRYTVKSFLELLAGIPSIVYGLIGVAFVSTWMEQWLDLSSGRTILTAGLLLAIMILPTLITLVEDALHSVPNQYRETARGLGMYRYEVIWHGVLPIAKADIISAILLALGRALGETMAVMLVIGGIDKIPQPFYNWLSPGQTITSKLGREMEEAAFGSLHFSALIFMGLMLLLVVLVITVLTQYYLKSARRVYD
jgi:phosphate transport system permease protein